MGRIRKISQDDILDAAERVVTKLGATGLSIDAVAQEAGVSKATVVYDHKSKSALLAALIDRQILREKANISASVAENADTPHPELFGRIMMAESAPDDVDKAVALMVCASTSTEEKFQADMREWIGSDLKAMADGPRPEAALMAYLALSGFHCAELFGFHHWSDEERSRIIDGLRNIYKSYSDKN